MPESYELREPLRTKGLTNHKVVKPRRAAPSLRKTKRPLLGRMACPRDMQCHSNELVGVDLYRT